MKSLSRLLGLWWISWFGIIGGFLMVGIGEYKHESPAASHFSITLMIVTILLWTVFFIADNRARKRIDGERSTTVVVDLLTLTGTFLADRKSTRLNSSHQIISYAVFCLKKKKKKKRNIKIKIKHHNRDCKT